MNNDKWKEWLTQSLVCPRDYQSLKIVKNTLVCPSCHIYHLVDDIPVMLIDDVLPTQEKEFRNSINTVKKINDAELNNNFHPASVLEKTLRVSHKINDPVLSC